MDGLDFSSLKPVGGSQDETPSSSGAAPSLDFSSLKPASQWTPPAPAQDQSGDDLVGQFGKGLVTGIPNALTGIAAAQERGRRSGVLMPGMDIMVGMAEPVIDSLTGNKTMPTQIDQQIQSGLSAIHANPNDYFPEPTSPGERIARMAGEGAITSIVPGGAESGWARLGQIAKEMFAGTVAGGASQAGVEVAPDALKPAVGLAAGLVGGIGGATLAELPGAGVRGAKGVRDYMAPTVARDATDLSTEAAVNTTTGRLAAKKLGAIATDPVQAAAAIEKAPEFVPGSRPTAFQASGDVGLGSFERALARNDDKFKAALLDRQDQQNTARVSALNSIEDTGDVGAAVQFFRDRMRTLENHADTLYDRADRAAKGQYDALGDRSAGDVGEQARTAIAGRFKDMNGEASALWNSIDPNHDLHVATSPLVDSTARIYGAMSPEEKLSLSPIEKNIAGIIGNYGDTLPFDRFKDLRSEITRGMRDSKSFANPNGQAYRRLSMLRDSVEQAVEQSVSQKFEADPSLAEDFARRAKEFYGSKTEAGTGADTGNATSSESAPTRTADGTRTAGDTGGESAAPEGDQGLSENGQRTSGALKQSGLEQSGVDGGSADAQLLPDRFEGASATPESAGRINVKQPRALNVEPIGNKALADRVRMDAEALSDFSERHAAAVQSGRFLPVPLPVLRHMLSVARSNDNVLGAIIRSLPVGMVDFLARQKLSPEKVLRDEAMLKDVLFHAVDRRGALEPVPLGGQPSFSVGSLIDVVARAAAEASGDLHSGLLGRNGELLPAVGAGKIGDGLFHQEDVPDPASISSKTGNTGAPIRDTMAERFAAAGRPPEEAVAAGELVNAFYTTMADRLGKPVDDLVVQHPLPQVRKGDDPEAQLFQPAYHGTPHIFDKFDSSKIGTGEGAQAFGHGLYFAGRKEVAQYYRDTLAGKAMTFKRGTDTIGLNDFEDRVKANAIAAGSTDEAFNIEARARLASEISHSVGVEVTQGGDLPHMRQFVRSSDWTPRVKAMWDGALREAESWTGTKPGRLLTVDVPEHHELMDWDKPLSEQSPQVLEKLHAMPEYQQVKRAWAERTGPSFGVSAEEAFNHPTNFDRATTAADFYREMSRELAGPPPAETNNWTHVNTGGDSDFRGDKAASTALREAGIPGHRYLEGASRTKPAAIESMKRDLAAWEGRLAQTPDDAYVKQEVEARRQELADAEKDIAHNYVIYDDSRVNVTNYEQPARGSIQFGDTGSIISMFKGADASTALHESGHHFLKMFRSMAESPDAPASIANDWRAAKAWWDKNANDVANDGGQGVTSADVRKVLREGTTGDRMKDLAVDRGLHEQWARGLETYLRDGKAPNSALRAIFQQFKDWLSSIYSHASQLGVKMSPEIRQVFDNMLATNASRGPRMLDEQAASRFSKATAATREIKNTFGTKPVKQILNRPGATYPYTMPDAAVAASIFKPGPDGAAAVQNAMAAGAPKEAVEAAAVLSLKRSATKDGMVDPAKLEAWRQKHGEALREVPELDRRLTSAGRAAEAVADLGVRRKAVIDEVQRSAVGKLLKVQDDADVSATLGRMLGKDTAVRDMRSLALEARQDPDALAGLRRGLVDHMISRMKTPKDTLRADTFQRFLGKNAPAISQVLNPEQMNALHSIALDMKRASKDVRAPGGGSDTAENLAGGKNYGFERPSILGQIFRRMLASGAVGVAAHMVQGPVMGAISGLASFLGGSVVQVFREAGIRHVDDLVREAVLNPELMKALLMKAPKRQNAGSAVTLRERLGRIAINNLAISSAQHEHRRQGAGS